MKRIPIRITFSCVAIIFSQLLITGITAGTVSNQGNLPNLNETPEKGFVDRSAIPGVSSGRSLVLWSLLLLPLGIGLVLLAIMALIPIPVIATGRGMPKVVGRAYENANKAIDLAKKVMTSEECVEKISCELSNFAKNHEMISWIPRRIESYLKPGDWTDKIWRGFHATNSCKQFNCGPMKKFE